MAWAMVEISQNARAADLRQKELRRSIPFCSCYPQMAPGFASKNKVTFLKTVRQSVAWAKMSST